MSQWNFISRAPSTDPKLAFSNAMVQHLEYIFQDFKPYVLGLDIPNATCSMQFNRRIFRVEVENRLQVNKIYHISVQGVFDPPLIYHPNSNILINEPLQPSASATTSQSIAYPEAQPLPRNIVGEITPPPSPPQLALSSQKTAPVLTVIKISNEARLPAIYNSKFLKLFAPFNFSIPPNSSYTINFGFALIPPPSFCFKIESRIPDENIYLTKSLHSGNFHVPLTLTFINLHSEKVFHVMGDSIIASVTCHRTYPNEILLLDSQIFPPQDHPVNLAPADTAIPPPITPISTPILEQIQRTTEDEPPIKKSSI